MRIIPDNTRFYELENVWGGGVYYYAPDTVEISDEEWALIFASYNKFANMYSPSQYLRELLILTGERK
jgi:hypothetical protein